MSILLDAVRRSQQHNDLNPDPIIEPTVAVGSQYQSSSHPINRGLLWGVLLLSCCLISLIIYLLVDEVNDIELPIQSSSLDVVVLSQVEKQPSIQLINRAENANTTTQSINGDIRLAGRVALPVAVERTTTAIIESSPEPQVAVANTEVKHKEDELIILGVPPKSSPNSSQTESEQQVIDTVKTEDRIKPSVNEATKTASEYQSEDALFAAFEAALKEIEAEKSIATPVTQPKLDPIPTSPSDSLPKYGQLPAAVQLQIPEFNIMAHVYASAPSNRWLNVDGAELQQGDLIGGKLTVVEIRPRDVVLAIDGVEFKVPAI